MMHAKATDQEDTHIPDGYQEAEKDFSCRLSTQKLLLFKAALADIAAATHQFIQGQVLTEAAYAMILARQGVPDEWIMWLLHVLATLPDEENSCLKQS